jgi:hypothetical protein
MSDVIHKTTLDARASRSAEPQEPPTIVSLYPGITAEQLALSATYAEVIYSFNRVVELTTVVVALQDEAIAAVRAEAEAKFGAIEARVAAAEAETLDLRSLLAGLTGELADAVHEIEKLRALRGNGDGRSLPTSITMPRVRPAKRKAAP